VASVVTPRALVERETPKPKERPSWQVPFRSIRKNIRYSAIDRDYAMQYRCQYNAGSPRGFAFLRRRTTRYAHAWPAARALSAIPAQASAARRPRNPAKTAITYISGPNPRGPLYFALPRLCEQQSPRKRNIAVSLAGLPPTRRLSAARSPRGLTNKQRQAPRQARRPCQEIPSKRQKLNPKPASTSRPMNDMLSTKKL